MHHFHTPTFKAKAIAAVLVMLPMAVVAVANQADEELTAFYRSSDYFAEKAAVMQVVNIDPIKERARLRALSRAHKAAIDACQKESRIDTNTAARGVIVDSDDSDGKKCPTIYDLQARENKLQAAAPKTSDVTNLDQGKRLSSEFNSKSVQITLRRYIRTGYCPASFKEVNEKAYQTCISVLDDVDHSAAPTNFAKDILWLRGINNRTGLKRAPTLRDYIRFTQGVDKDMIRETIRPSAPAGYQFK